MSQTSSGHQNNEMSTTAASRPNTAASIKSQGGTAAAVEEEEAVEDIQDLTMELLFMQKKERDLLSALTAINDAFFDLGVPISTSFIPKSVSEEKSKEVGTPGYHPDKFRKYGIRMNEELSFRGQDKAREYFEDILDMDCDGFIDYEESRAVHAFRHPYGLIKDASHQSREAWRTFMKNEGYESLNQTNTYIDLRGISTVSNKLSVNDYVKYRTNVEKDQPLQYELYLLGLGYLPKYLERWNHLNTVVREVVEYRESCRSMTEQDLKRLEGVLSIDEMVFVIQNCDLRFTKPEMMLLLFWRRQKANMLAHFLRVYAKRNISQREYPFEIAYNKNHTGGTSRPNSKKGKKKVLTNTANNTGAKEAKDGIDDEIPGSSNEYKLVIGDNNEENIIHSDDMDRVPINQFKAWFLTVPKFLNFSTWYRYIQQGKYKMNRWIRHFSEGCKFLFHFAGHMNDRLIFRDFPVMNKCSKILQEACNVKFSIEIGGTRSSMTRNDDDDDEEGAGGGGISFNWKLMKMESAETLMKTVNIPTSCGTVFYVDLLFKDHVSAQMQKEVSDTIKKYLLQQVEKELKMNMNFTMLQCLAMKNEYDESPILRIVLSYKKLVSLDKFLEHMLLQYRVTDLVTIFVGEVKTNIDFWEYVNNKLNCLNDMLQASISCTIGFRKNLIVALMERLMLAVGSGLTEEQATFLDKNKAKAPSSSSSVKSNSSKSTVSTAKKSKEASNEAEDDTAVMRFFRWTVIHPYYQQIYDFLKQWRDWIYPWKSAIIRYHYKNLHDFIMKVAYATSNAPDRDGDKKSFFPTVLSDEMNTFLFQPGFVREFHQQFVSQFQREFEQMLNDLKDFLENRRKEDDARRLKELLTFTKKQEEAAKEKQQDSMTFGNSVKEKEDKKAATLERMKRIGLTDHEDMLTNEEHDRNPMAYIHSLETDHRLGDVTNMKVMQLLCDNLVGVHSMELITGKCKITALIQGMDIFEYVPKLSENLQATIDRTSLQKKNK